MGAPVQTIHQLAARGVAREGFQFLDGRAPRQQEEERLGGLVPQRRHQPLIEHLVGGVRAKLHFQPPDFLLHATPRRSREEPRHKVAVHGFQRQLTPARFRLLRLQIILRLKAAQHRVEVGVDERRQFQPLDAGSIVQLFHVRAVGAMEKRVENDVVILEILRMAVAVPVGGIDMNLHVAPHATPAHLDLRITKIRTRAKVPAPRLNHPQRPPRAGLQTIAEKQLLMPYSLHQLLVHPSPPARKRRQGLPSPQRPARSRQPQSLAQLLVRLRRSRFSPFSGAHKPTSACKKVRDEKGERWGKANGKKRGG
jgi:hypothetical protein